MKSIRKFLRLFLFTFVILGCVDENDNNADFIETITEPTNISALVSISQDNSGLVTITPTGEGVVTYNIDFGDGSDLSESINPGNSTQHIYSEGTHQAVIIGSALDGSTAQATATVVVSFIAPENLEVNISTIFGSYDIMVSASADYATSFLVLFGDEVGGDATTMQIGEQVSHTYIGAGTYSVTVIALSGGAATTEYTQEVIINDTQPIQTIEIENFEGDVPASFSFGGVGSVQVIPNPDSSGENTTGNVLQFVKDEGAEVWGGMGIAVDIIDFDGASQIQIKSYAPEAGKVVKVKLETSAGNVSGLTHEMDMNTTVANQWETLTYDFTEAPDLEYISFIVFYDFGNTQGATYRFDEIQLID